MLAPVSKWSVLRLSPVYSAGFLFCLTVLMAQVPTQALLMPHMAVGGGWETEVTLIGQGAETSAGTMQFFDQSGEPMEVLVDGVVADSVAYSLPSGTARTFRLTAGAEVRVGYIYIAGSLDGPDRGSINGTGTFRFRDNGAVVTQVGVLAAPLVRIAHLPYNNTGQNRTAMAIAASPIADSSLLFKRFNEAGALQETLSEEFDVFSQRALFVDELFPASAGTRGFLSVEADLGFNWMALNQNTQTLSLSNAQPLTGVLERDIVMMTNGDTSSTWLFRFTVDTTTVQGVADRVSPNPLNEFLLSGTLQPAAWQPDESGQGILSFSMQSFSAEGVVQTTNFLARFTDDSLSQDVDGVWSVFDVNGDLVDQGTFQMSRPAGALF